MTPAFIFNIPISLYDSFNIFNKDLSHINNLNHLNISAVLVINAQIILYTKNSWLMLGWLIHLWLHDWSISNSVVTPPPIWTVYFIFKEFILYLSNLLTLLYHIFICFTFSSLAIYDFICYFKV